MLPPEAFETDTSVSASVSNSSSFSSSVAGAMVTAWSSIVVTASLFATGRSSTAARFTVTVPTEMPPVPSDTL